MAKDKIRPPTHSSLQPGEPDPEAGLPDIARSPDIGGVGLRPDEEAVHANVVGATFDPTQAAEFRAGFSQPNALQQLAPAPRVKGGRELLSELAKLKEELLRPHDPATHHKLKARYIEVKTLAREAGVYTGR